MDRVDSYIKQFGLLSLCVSVLRVVLGIMSLVIMNG